MATPKNGKSIAATLALIPHPEGGYYREVYRSESEFPDTGNQWPSGRSYGTSIYYLLERGDFSCFHRIRSDELWYHHSGGAVTLYMLRTDVGCVTTHLGGDYSSGEVPQAVMPAGAWFAAECRGNAPYALAGCAVFPGFDFRDFEIGSRAALIALFPEQQELITRLTRE